MPAGFADPAAARSAITEVGSRVIPAVLIATKRTIAFVAVPGQGFSFFEFLHGTDAEGRGCIAQTHEVGGKIEDHRAGCRVVRRHLRKEPDHQWTDETSEDDEYAAGFGHFHQPQEKGHYPDEAQRQFNGTS